MLERRYYHFLFQMNSHRKYSVRRIDYLDLSVRGRSHLVMTEEEKFIRHKKKRRTLRDLRLCRVLRLVAVDLWCLIVNHRNELNKLRDFRV